MPTTACMCDDPEQESHQPIHEERLEHIRRDIERRTVSEDICVMVEHCDWQADEIERLKETVDTLRDKIAKFAPAQDYARTLADVK